MLNSERFTHRRELNNYNRGELTKVINMRSAGNNAVVTEPDDYVTQIGKFGEHLTVRTGDSEYFVGDIVDRLYDYEQLGYSPEELKEIIRRYKDYRFGLNSICGMIDRLNEKRDREKLDSLYRLLRDVREDKQSTKAELGVAIEVAINRIGEVLNDLP